MENGWMAFAIVSSIILFAGIVLAAALLRAAWAQREREALTSNDLRALEESAIVLIEQLKSEVELGLEAIQARESELLKVIHQADERLSTLQDIQKEISQLTNEVCVKAGDDLESRLPTPIGLKKQRVLELVSSGADCAEIARTAGLDCAEVKLMLRLEKLQTS